MKLLNTCYVNVNQKGLFVGIVGGGPVYIHSSGHTDFSLSHIEGITLGAGVEVDEVVGALQNDV